MKARNIEGFGLITGKWVWRTILYLTNDLKYQPLGGDYKADYSVRMHYENGSKFWKDYNNAPTRKYSYRWCLRWLKTHPSSSIWDDLFMKDSYLKVCCDKKKIRSLDQLAHYADEYWRKK